MTRADPVPELLAPAGGLPQLRAAIHAGADAVYFGLDRGFNARVRAPGIANQHLEAMMAELHEHGRRGYLTLNTLVFDGELAELEEQIRHAARCGVDALIVQDIGLARLARAAAPDLPLHGSTQMSITDAEGVAFARELGIRRVVLGRELSIDEIAQVRTAVPDVEIEVFVHGALCVSYSGQCFSSEAWGGRSANRGQCAQACRLPYGLLVDGELREQQDFHYLLSPQDLMALPLLPRLVQAGVHSLKIEGRLKGPEYVQQTVSAYRAALDRLGDSAAGSPITLTVYTPTRRRLAQVFSRGQDETHDGLSVGFLDGPRHQELVIGRNPRHRGLHLGRVTGVLKDGVRLKLHNPVKPGDGVVFDQGRPQELEPGGNVHAIEHRRRRIQAEIDRGTVTLRFGPDFDPSTVQVGDHLWRTRDAAQDGGPKLRPADAVRLPVRLEVRGSAGEPLSITLTAPDGRQGRGQTRQPLAPATRRPLDEARVVEAIGELGDTPYRIDRLESRLAPGLFVPIGQIKQARRQAVEALRQALTRHQRGRSLPPSPVLETLIPTAGPPEERPGPPVISLLCRTAAQVEAALALDGLEEIIVDFLEVHGLKAACHQVRRAGRRLIVAAPRILKPGEERLVRYLLRLDPDALLIRSASLLHRLGRGTPDERGRPRPALWGDFSLNAANRLAASHLLSRGLARLTPTHDLNARQIADLARGLPSEQRRRIEVIIHQHLPIFHTEHCVFARFLSRGNSYRDCGRPCERHRVHLRDPKAKDHLLLADIGCRNTLFNAQAQSAAEYLAEFQAAGIGRFRIELVDEPADAVEPLVSTYRSLLRDDLRPAEALRRLARIPDANWRPQGVGAGSLIVRAELPKRQMKRPTAR